MNHTRKILQALMLLLPLSILAKSHLLDEGISWQLAQHRKALISDLSYSLSFRIPEEKTQSIEAEETVSFCLGKRSDVILDFAESADKISEVRLGENGEPCQWLMQDGHLVIPKRYTRRGSNAFHIRFTAGNQGLNRRDGYVYTLFVPDRAHTVFPCFDQPDMKARFALTLDIPDGWSVAQNGVPTEPGRHRYAIDTPIPTYLFAFAAGEFSYQAYEEDGYRIGAFYRETDSARIAQLPDIMHQVVFSLRWQEAFTGQPYPFPKYDLVILPGFQFGGMEHVGATFYNDNTIFLPPHPTPDEQLRRTELIAHETSHMWFGDAVTMAWFNDVWTKEVFANYFAAEITAPLFPDLDHGLNWLRTYQGAAIGQDRTEGRTSIRQPLDNLRYAGLIYNAIIYNKAPVMMRKLVSVMGRETFQRGIRRYVRDFLYGNATWDQLIDILDSETPADLKSFSREWVEEAHWPQRRAVSFCDASDVEYYGFTELTTSQVDSLLAEMPQAGAPLMAAMMTLHENYLNHCIPADRFADIMLDMTASDDPLTCATALGYLKEPMCELGSAELERRVLDISESHALTSVRTQALRLLIASAISPAMVQRLHAIWEANDTPLLSVNDYMTLSYELAIRMPDRAADIIARQRSRISNPDRLAQFDFISRAVAPSQADRDSLFASLVKAENRRIEPWTQSVLYYLNHPLRQAESIHYIRPALEMLPDIQRTGDIFFPGNWCTNLLAGHRSPEAYQEVERFLSDHRDMHPLLLAKVRQAKYMLERANCSKR